MQGAEISKRPGARDGFLYRSLIALSATLLLVMLSPLLAGRIWIRDDLGAFHLPVRDFYSRCLAEGNQFDWMPGLFSGFFLTGDGQVGSYHPWHYLLYRAMPLRLAFGLEIWTNYVAMLLGMFVWLRLHLRERAAALYGAVVFTFSGFNLLHFIHPNAISVVAHLPWLLAAAQLLGRPSLACRVGGSLAIALLTGSQVLLGYPQYVWFSVVAEGIYVGVLFGWRPLVLGWLLLLKLEGLLLGGVQLLPTWDLYSLAERRLAEDHFILDASLHPLNAVQLVAPYLFQKRVVGINTHELGCYIGAVPLLVSLWLAFERGIPRPARRMVLASLVLGGFAALMACGENAWIYRLQMALPVVGSFRAPARYIVLVHFAIATVSAVAFSALQKHFGRPMAKPRPRFWLAALPLLSLVSTVLLSGTLDRQYLSRGVLIAVGPAICVAAALALAWALRGSLTAMLLLVAITGVDLGAYGFSYAVLRDTVTDIAQVTSVTDPAADRSRRLAVEPPTFGRDIPERFGNSLLLRGWQQADGYAGLAPRSELFGAGISLQGLQAAGVEWVWAGSLEEPLAGLQPWTAGWLQVPDPAPRFRMVADVVVAGDPQRAIAQIDPRRTAVVANDLQLESGPRGTVDILRDAPGDIRLRVVSSTRQLLVISERFHPGWRVIEDGAVPHTGADSPRRRIDRVNGDFMGVVVEPGEHEVALAFQPDSVRLGKYVSLCGVLLLVATLVVFAIFVGRSKCNVPGNSASALPSP